MKWIRSKTKDPDSGRCSWTSGRWTIQTHKDRHRGWSRTAYHQWDIPLDGEMFWDERGHRYLCAYVNDAMEWVEKFQREWDEQGFLIVSNTGALNENRTTRRVE